MVLLVDPDQEVLLVVVPEGWAGRIKIQILSGPFISMLIHLLVQLKPLYEEKKRSFFFKSRSAEEVPPMSTVTAVEVRGTVFHQRKVTQGLH